MGSTGGVAQTDVSCRALICFSAAAPGRAAVPVTGRAQGGALFMTFTKPAREAVNLSSRLGFHKYTLPPCIDSSCGESIGMDSLKVAKNAFLEHCKYSRSLSPHTVSAYDQDLSDFLRFCGAQTRLQDIGEERITGFLRDLTRHRRLSAATA